MVEVGERECVCVAVPFGVPLPPVTPPSNCNLPKKGGHLAMINPPLGKQEAALFHACNEYRMQDFFSPLVSICPLLLFEKEMHPVKLE